MTHETHLLQLQSLIRGMRKAFASGKNAMQYAREHIQLDQNVISATLIAYDLQAGNYSDAVRANLPCRQRWNEQLAALLEPLLPAGGSLLEVGCGEANTLCGILAQLTKLEPHGYGCDISWSRIKEGNAWLNEYHQQAQLFVGDLFHIPFADNSIDVVYSSHSLEPNGGQEEQAIKECLRVARHAVVLVEPLYELANETAQQRMAQHGYVRDLRQTAEQAGAEIIDYRLLDFIINPLNPSGVLALRKKPSDEGTAPHSTLWRCPLTGAALTAGDEAYFAKEVGIAYPVLQGIPLLRREHAVVASAFQANDAK